MYSRFERDIVAMNSTYELGVIDTSNDEKMVTRLDNFKKILVEECEEIDDVRQLAFKSVNEDERLDAIVALADLLGDLIVYCVSEAERWNIPIGQVLYIIMQSNFSKLDNEGRPIKDERGKFLKGPNYWKPEPAIKELLLRMKAQRGELTQIPIDMDAVVAAATQQHKPTS